MLYSTRIFCCWELCSGERNGEEVLQPAGGCLCLSAPRRTSHTKPWKSVLWLTGCKNKGALCAYRRGGCPSADSSVVNGKDRLLYEMVECEYSLWIRGIPVCTTGDQQHKLLQVTRAACWADQGSWCCHWQCLDEGETHLGIFWNPTFTGVGGPFAHCRHNYSNCSYLFVLRALKQQNDSSFL